MSRPKFFATPEAFRAWCEAHHERETELLVGYTIRFTPRKARSNWSAVNVKRMAVLIAEGRVRPAGHA